MTSGCGAPFRRISAAHGWKRGPAPGKRYRSELMWRRPPFWGISAAHGWKRGPAVDKEKPISKRSSPVSHHKSGGQVQALALVVAHRSRPSINYLQRDPLAKKQCTFPAPKKKQVEAEMEDTLRSSCGAPFRWISAAHGWKRGPAPGKRYRSELMWRRISAAHGWKRGPAVDKESRSAKEAVQFPITKAEVKFKPLHCSGAIEAGQA